LPTEAAKTAVGGLEQKRQKQTGSSNPSNEEKKSGEQSVESLQRDMPA